ncbi:hypothetical protein FACS1894166_09570 [Bacilli bacterium]|nr:hypothetical protein FACS1894166_09570 [Bacilli bacterium]
MANNTYRAVNVNNQVSTGDAGVRTINLPNQTIKLKTLEIGYTNTLTNLNCPGNSLTTLAVSNIPALKYLYCDDNSLTTLDVSSNLALESLTCFGNSSLQKLYLPVQNIDYFVIYANPNLTDIYTKSASGIQTIDSNQSQSNGINRNTYTIHRPVGSTATFSGKTYNGGTNITFTYIDDNN